ncbi:MAG: hypothetical protein IKK69_08350 [Firmicutes bacterium]|nr:hypothetical protein [Bacillota bacterium]
MKRFLEKSLVLIMAMVMVFMAAIPVTAATTAASDGSLVVTSYTVSDQDINKGETVTVSIHLKHTSITASDIGDAANLDISRKVDSFSGGQIAAAMTSSSGPLEFDVSISGLKYNGSGSSLKLMVGYKNAPGIFDDIEVNLIECREYEEPVYEPSEPYVPDPVAAPMMIISRNEILSPIKAGEEMTVTVTVENIGTTSMQSPVISFTPSSSLMLTGTSSMYQMKTIAPKKSESIDVKVKALDDISGQVQYIDADVKFQYFNRVTTADGSGSGRVIIPAQVKKTEEPDPSGIDSPVPNLIVEHFSYGGSSVAAGDAFTLNFRFRNTSGDLPVENVVVTVDGGTSFTINGAANTFYFDEIEFDGEETVTVPMKALQTLTNGAEPVMINFKYEYVDNQKRMSNSSDVKITVPVYQPDRFEIASPVVPVMVYSGEEIAIMMNYVNKGKSPVNNVEARVEGNIDTITPVQNLGNIEAGRSGTMAFAVTAFEPGENQFTIKVIYEDANGDEKLREFPVTINVEEMPVFDPGIMEPVIPPEPEKTFPWNVVAAVAAIAAIVGAVIFRKKKKAAKAKKEAQMWAEWNDEEGE